MKGTLKILHNETLSRLPLESGGEMIWHDSSISPLVGRSKTYGDVKNEVDVKG